MAPKAEPDGSASRSHGDKLIASEATTKTDGAEAIKTSEGHEKHCETTGVDNSKFGYYIVETTALKRGSKTDVPTAGQNLKKTYNKERKSI